MIAFDDALVYGRLTLYPDGTDQPAVSFGLHVRRDPAAAYDRNTRVYVERIVGRTRTKVQDGFWTEDTVALGLAVERALIEAGVLGGR